MFEKINGTGSDSIVQLQGVFTGWVGEITCIPYVHKDWKKASNVSQEQEFFLLFCVPGFKILMFTYLQGKKMR